MNRSCPDRRARRLSCSTASSCCGPRDPAEPRIARRGRVVVRLRASRARRDCRAPPRSRRGSPGALACCILFSAWSHPRDGRPRSARAGGTVAWLAISVGSWGCSRSGALAAVPEDFPDDGVVAVRRRLRYVPLVLPVVGAVLLWRTRAAAPSGGGWVGRRVPRPVRPRPAPARPERAGHVRTDRLGRGSRARPRSRVFSRRQNGRRGSAARSRDASARGRLTGRPRSRARARLRLRRGRDRHGQAQPSGERPRLWRLLAERGLRSRMDFNNGEPSRPPPATGPPPAPGRAAVVSVNIGKSKVTPPERAMRLRLRPLVAPYAALRRQRLLAQHPGLRDLQSVDALRPILRECARP